MPHYPAAHGYIQLILANPANGLAAIQAIRRWATTPGNLRAGETVENVAWMEDPTAPANATATANRPMGDHVFVEVSLANYPNPINSVAHERVEAIAQIMEGLNAGTVSHFRNGLRHHWCCYSDI